MKLRLSDIFLYLLAWPYYWTLRHYTIYPIQRIVLAQHDEDKLRTAARTFFHGKINEAKLVTLASTLSAAASFAAFSWTAIARAPWFVFAFWYFSLVLAILSLITAGQHSALIHTLIQHEDAFYEALPTKVILRLVALDVSSRIGAQQSSGRGPNRSGPPAKARTEAQQSAMMVYVWQNPVMKMAWSVVMFILGLVLLITSPLRHDPPGIDDPKIAIFVLVAGAVVLLNFGWCSFCLYRAAKHDDLMERPATTAPGEVDGSAQVAADP
ncbi:hypothetical protein C7974DRAFT_425261 [Boeremia exigua]|uniref:uncharacterized protein n=1 Tax=Boeremia exigua TaxID=749465 RepID=UPI001E8CDD0C|nr:uncharacterized protein C7974DRAFT_425261 [Boeremia exigua]KAH6625630.1 hypothetical protein C7974DRAFT_425261 [Boeremia exigua]